MLQELSADNSEAQGLYTILIKLETGIYLAFLNELLERVNKTSIKLQSCDSDLNTSIALLKSLKSFIELFREKFDYYEAIGKKSLIAMSILKIKSEFAHEMYA